VHPDAQSDTRSPWYEAFAPQTRPLAAGVRWVTDAVQTAADGAARPETVEAEWSTQALFDCYNG
jgi:hypothetical protein